MPKHKNPELTRGAILRAAFDEVRRVGFRSAGLDGIAKQAGLTKGAFYHHFPNKAALGVAVVDELIRPHVRKTWIEPLRATNDPAEAISASLASVAGHSCPLGDLSQEMSAVDDEIRQHLHAVFQEWRDELAEALRRAKLRSYVEPGLDCDAAAAFIVASIEGSLLMAKNAADPELVALCRRAMNGYFISLRPVRRAAAAAAGSLAA